MYPKENYNTGGSYSSSSYGIGTCNYSSKRRKDGCCEGGCGTACVRYKSYQ